MTEINLSNGIDSLPDEYRKIAMTLEKESLQVFNSAFPMEIKLNSNYSMSQKYILQYTINYNNNFL